MRSPGERGRDAPPNAAGDGQGDEADNKRGAYTVRWTAVIVEQQIEIGKRAEAANDQRGSSGVLPSGSRRDRRPAGRDSSQGVSDG